MPKSCTRSLITLDVLMPDIDGWTVLAALRGNPELADIPVVMATITDDQQHKGMTLGAAGYLTKPIDRDRLIALLQPYQARVRRTRVLVVEDDPTQRERIDLAGIAAMADQRSGERPGGARPAGGRCAGHHLARSHDAGDEWIPADHGIAGATRVARHSGHRDYVP